MTGFRSFIIVVILVLLPFVASNHECKIKDGKEANLEDEGCETYWICKNYVGVNKMKCPDGGQIDFKENICKTNNKVWCQWQHKQLEKGQLFQKRGEESESMRQKIQNILGENYYYYVDGDTSSSSSGSSSEEEDKGNKGDKGDKGDKGYVDYNSYNSNDKSDEDFYHDIDQWTYVCMSEWGHEPNLDDHHCQSFWRCDHYKGTVIQCKHGQLYDYHAKACRSRHLVDCHEQHHNHVTSQPKHKVEVKKNPDGSVTLIHHYYYDNE